MPGSSSSVEKEMPHPAGPDAGSIEVQDVSKNFGPLAAVSHAGFSVSQGSLFGLVGSDGAGKTTLLRMMATMVRPSSGRILINGLDVVREKVKIKDMIGYMPQRFGLYEDLTVDENLAFFMDIFGIPGDERKERRERYLGFSNLLSFVERPAGALSGGMKQKLGLACVLVHQPEVLILDEPTNGVDPVSRGEFWEILARMREQGMTIVVATAYLDEGEKCDRLILMHRSQVLQEASPAEIQSDFASLEEAMVQRISELEGESGAEGFGL